MLNLCLNQRHPLWVGLMIINSIHVKRKQVTLPGAHFSFLSRKKFFLFNFFAVLRVTPWALYMLGKHSTTKLHS